MRLEDSLFQGVNNINHIQSLVNIRVTHLKIDVSLGRLKTQKIHILRGTH